MIDEKRERNGKIEVPILKLTPQRDVLEKTRPCGQAFPSGFVAPGMHTPTKHELEMPVSRLVSQEAPRVELVQQFRRVVCLVRSKDTIPLNGRVA